jgi:TPR repeat protein
VKNKAEAAQYCKLAADQNDTDAQYGYVTFLVNGRGVALGEAEAVGYLKLAAD